VRAWQVYLAARETLKSRNYHATITNDNYQTGPAGVVHKIDANRPPPDIGAWGSIVSAIKK
jgi:hypothetical protein